ncbi:hypothetical protein FRB95_002098 [Tulasnella sp. JGI-2019a]|nr:hypothetical protein FRB95_002098 [Tulasnella sp. JGI-2019a]
MFVIITDFVQQAFLLRPAAALFFRLDLVFEGLIQNTKRWEKDVAERRDVDGNDTIREEADDPCPAFLAGTKGICRI